MRLAPLSQSLRVFLRYSVWMLYVLYVGAGSSNKLCTVTCNTTTIQHTQNTNSPLGPETHNYQHFLGTQLRCLTQHLLWHQWNQDQHPIITLKHTKNQLQNTSLRFTVETSGMTIICSSTITYTTKTNNIN